MNTHDSLANRFGNDYTSPSTYFEYAPMGLVKDFNVDLRTALETLNIPVGTVGIERPCIRNTHQMVL